MSFIDRLLGRKTPQPKATEAKGFATSSVPYFGMAMDTAGQNVNPFSALSASAVYACVRAISDDVAKLPIRFEKRNAGGGWELEPRHPIARLLTKPNRWQTPIEFMNFVVASLQLRGNAYVAVLRDDTGSAVELVPVAFDRVSVLVNDKTGRLFYQATHEAWGRSTRQFDQDDMLHIRNMSLDSIWGLSPVSYAAETIGIALATQRHTSNYFENGAHLSGVLSTPEVMSPEGRSNLAHSWTAAYGGVSKAGKVALLEEGVTYSPISHNAVDSQLIETRKFIVEDIARYFRVPLHKLGMMDGAKYSNVEQTAKAYIDDTLIPVCRRIEEAMMADLLFDNERGHYRVRFDFEEMLRSDKKTQLDALAVGLQNGIYTQNEARAALGLERKDGGDELRVQLNTGAVDAAGNASAPTPAPDPTDAQEG